ncbi:MAG: carboxypeptidase-like regulatory domain-containing protein, partial [Bacteroidota bacterium]
STAPIRSGEIHYQASPKVNPPLDFEPGYSYVIQPSRERLYEYDWKKLADPLPRKWATQTLGDLVLHPADLEAFDHPELDFTYHQNGSDNRSKRNGATYVFKAPTKDPKKLLFILERDSTVKKIFPAHTTRIQNLKAGNYTLYQLNRDGSYWQQDFSLGEKEWLFQDLSDRVLVPDITYALFKKVLPKKYQDQFPEVEKLLDYDTQRQLLGKTNKAWGETGMLTGIVLDKDTEEPLPFANVFVKGTSVGAVTDFDGRFALEVPYRDYELLVSYIGYDKHVVRMDASMGEIEILLEPQDAVLMESVVVVGYNKSKVSSLPTRDISALASTVAGLSVVDEERLRQAERVPEAIVSSTASLPSGVQLRQNFKDYAAWQPRLSTDENGEAYYTIRYPDNTTLWKHYVIGMNDQQEAGIAMSEASAYKKVMARLSVPRFFIAGDESELLGKSLNYRGDTLAIESTFQLDQTVLQSRKSLLASALIEKAKIEVPPKDSVQLSYTLTSGAYGDGEEYRIPVLPKGVEEAVGSFYFLDRDTSFHLEFDPADGPIQVHAEQDVLNFFQHSIDYLVQYPYGCNEQLASQLTANLLAKQINQQRGERFEKSQYIERGINKLTKRQQAEGYWSWWTETQPDLWMTTYVLRALHEAKQMNYEVPALDKGLVYLTNHLERYKGRQLLSALELLADVGQSLDYEKALQSIPDSLIQANLNVRLTMAKIRQQQQLPIDLEVILKERKQTIFGASYWGKKQYRWYDNDIQNTLLAYTIFKRAGRPDIYRSIEHYLLQQRQRRCWRNTFETARIIATLLPAYLEASKALTPNQNTLYIGQETINTKDFPFTRTLVGGANLRIKKTGRLPVYLTLYQERWNPEPQPVADHFVVQSWLKQEGQKTNDLKTGSIAQLRVEVEVKRKADYLQLEVPIPAACAYSNKRQSYAYRSGETYREYFKDRVAIYCRSLKPGTYTFRIDLEPRFTGTYTLNPAKMEEMYFPVFYGREGLKQVLVR